MKSSTTVLTLLLLLGPWALLILQHVEIGRHTERIEALETHAPAETVTLDQHIAALEQARREAAALVTRECETVLVQRGVAQWTKRNDGQPALQWVTPATVSVPPTTTPEDGP